MIGEKKVNEMKTTEATKTQTDGVKGEKSKECY